MSYAADDYEAIRRREEELKAERNLALTGSTAQVPLEEVKVGEYVTGWSYTAATDYDPA